MPILHWLKERIRRRKRCTNKNENLHCKFFRPRKWRKPYIIFSFCIHRRTWIEEEERRNEKEKKTKIITHIQTNKRIVHLKPEMMNSLSRYVCHAYVCVRVYIIHEYSNNCKRNGPIHSFRFFSKHIVFLFVLFVITDAFFYFYYYFYFFLFALF